MPNPGKPSFESDAFATAQVQLDISMADYHKVDNRNYLHILKSFKPHVENRQSETTCVACSKSQVLVPGDTLLTINIPALNVVHSLMLALRLASFLMLEKAGGSWRIMQDHGLTKTAGNLIA